MPLDGYRDSSTTLIGVGSRFPLNFPPSLPRSHHWPPLTRGGHRLVSASARRAAGARDRSRRGIALVPAGTAPELAALQRLVDPVQDRVLPVLGDRAGLDQLVEVRFGGALDGCRDRSVVDVLVLGNVIERLPALELALQLVDREVQRRRRGLANVVTDAGLDGVLEQVSEAGAEEGASVAVGIGNPVLHRVADRLREVATGHRLVDRRIGGCLGGGYQRSLIDAELLGELVEEGLAVRARLAVDGEATFGTRGG